MDRLIAMNPADRPVVGGAHLSSGMQIDTGWHFHDMHQLLYAFDGSVEIEDATARYLVPHQFAAWIPAGTRHRTRIQQVGSGSVFLARSGLVASETTVRIVRAPPLMREMIKEAMRWPIMEAVYDRIAESFFQAFALLLRDWIAENAPLVLPTTSDPRLGKVIEFTHTHLTSVTLREVCSRAGMSERTLRRQFLTKLGMTWEEYRLRYRIFKALALLEQERIPISEIAAAVGYGSQSAFAKAFKTIMRESPSCYRQRRFAALGSYGPTV